MATTPRTGYRARKPKAIDTSGDPEKLTDSVVDLAKFVDDEFAALASSLQEVMRLQISNVAPTKPRQGMVVYADGTNWNPGSGEGVYFRNAAGVWVPASSRGTVIRVQVFTSSGTYMSNANLLYSIFECMAAGGGGGGVANTAVGTAGSAGGGGSGSYSRKIVSAATIGASQVVTIGAGGSAGIASNGTGGNGGDTSIGSLCIAKGGSGGVGGAGASGGAGGIAGTGDFTPTGSSGGPGQTQSIVTVGITGGYGAASVFGGGVTTATLAGTTGRNGSAGANYGAGGSGGATYNSGGGATGGAGANGVAIVTEICWQ